MSQTIYEHTDHPRETKLARDVARDRLAKAVEDVKAGTEPDGAIVWATERVRFHARRNLIAQVYGRPGEPRGER